MTTQDLIKEAAKIIYLVHDELKDKNFELELSWVSKDTAGIHQKVPESVFTEAEKCAKQAMDAELRSRLNKPLNYSALPAPPSK